MATLSKAIRHHILPAFQHAVVCNHVSSRRSKASLVSPLVEDKASLISPFIEDSLTDNSLKRSSQLKMMLNSSELEFIMEAHNGLSARIVQEAGFRGIWASGLSMAAQYGVRDCNEASWTQVLDMLEFMSDAAPRIPILVDADTGYGNFNNARRLVRKLQDRNIAGVCLEDKLFPKTNSLLDGRAQPLADMREFALKIKACKETQYDPDFCVLARVEALIAGHGMDEALRRAEAYRNAGADAVLIHSKKSEAGEITEFMQRWHEQGPVVIVPTKYYKEPTDVFRNAGVSLVIWANHNLRACVSAMQTVCQQIHDDESLVHIEPKVSPVNEIFRLQDDDELRHAEDKYLPSHG